MDKSGYKSHSDIAIAETASTVEARLQEIRAALRLKSAQVRAVDLLHASRLLDPTPAYRLLDKIDGGAL